jgi:hypothetical protein
VPVETDQATLLALDACLGTVGLPQSASGQATLLTGLNVPSLTGSHYGPKPNAEIAAFLRNGNLFSRIQQAGLSADFVNAYPPGYFEAIRSGKRNYSAIPMAASVAGLPLHTMEDYYAGRALPADFTGEGWRTHLGFTSAPLVSPFDAGVRLAGLAIQVDLGFFEFWLSDYAGHRQDMQAGLALLETLDEVVGGLISRWKDGLILITSDHGNLEDLSTRRHTANPVPALLIGPSILRRRFAENLQDLTGVTPAILNILSKEGSSNSRQSL